ncbi:MAG TPA: SRPBCC domain-containing protein [Candidatus Saccharimonadales bacterium]|nr:SRPBCC domain-containing protein [Candidatus Saccharimonadales bacterium]
MINKVEKGLAMSSDSYSQIIKTSAVPSVVIDRISQVSEWWGRNFEGEATEVGNEFTVRFQNGDMYKIKVAEIVPNRKVVWNVITAHQTWVKDPAEWVGTKIIWEVKEVPGGTEVHFTHEGLVPQLECFDQCAQGWAYLMNPSFMELLNTGKGRPQAA